MIENDLYQIKTQTSNIISCLLFGLDVAALNEQHCKYYTRWRHFPLLCQSVLHSIYSVWNVFNAHVRPSSLCSYQRAVQKNHIVGKRNVTRAYSDCGEIKINKERHWLRVCWCEDTRSWTSFSVWRTEQNRERSLMNSCDTDRFLLN